MEFEEQNQFKKELEKELPDAKTLEEQLETKISAYDRLNTRLHSRLYGYKALLKELVNLEQKAIGEKDDSEIRLQVNLFEVQYEFDLFVKEYVRTLEAIKEALEAQDTIYRQLRQVKKQ